MPHRPGHERILIAEDEEISRRVIVGFLEYAGYRVLQANNGQEALKLALKEKPDLILIDLEMPEMSGWDVIESLRQRGEATPVMVLSGRAELQDRVRGLEIGADDYMTKPFEAVELVARVQALLRRHGRQNARLETLTVGGTQIDLPRKIAKVGGVVVRLTRIECAIIEVLALNRGQPVSREQMLDRVWGYTYLPTTRTLDTHIWRLRKKIGDDGPEERWIKNLSGIGYLLEREDQWP